MNKKLNLKTVVMGVIILLTVCVAGFVLYVRQSRDWALKKRTLESGHVVLAPIQNSIVRAPIQNSNEDLVGATDYIFVGKVVDSPGTENYFGKPSTLFNVEVIYNIKGNLQGKILVMQNGAVADGAVHVVSYASENNKEDVFDLDKSLLLKPRSTYLLLLGYSVAHTKYILDYVPLLEKLISNDSTLSNEQLNDLARRDDRVYELLSAYVNEKLWRPNVLNRFDSLSAPEKQAVFDKFANLIPPRPVPIITPKTVNFPKPGQ